MNSIIAERLRRDLRASLEGEVLADEMSRLLYSTDASLYQIVPTAVALPRHPDDVAAAVRVAGDHGVSILPRGGGTSLAGQTVSSGLVLDFSKYMNRVLEVNREERWVRVQPGVVLDDLNDALAAHGLFFAPDVATSSRANIGGMMGNNSAGVRSVRYGKTVDHVLEMTVFLSSGDRLQCRRLDRPELDALCSGGGREAEIYSGVRRVVAHHRDEILARFPKVMRRVSGYNLDELLDEDRFNLSKLFVGSEGTLGVVVEAKLNLEPIPAARALVVLHFRELLDAIRTVPALLEYDPTAVEILDRYGLDLARGNPAVAGLCREFLHDDPDAILMVEFGGESVGEVERSLRRMSRDAAVRSRVFHTYQAREPSQQQVVWQVRKNALGVMLGIKGDYKPLPFVEDSAVPVEHLADYVADVQDVCRRHDRRLALYAHASVGLIHLRPILNLKQEADVEILQSISDEVFDLVRKYGGAWSGEHGDGLVRSHRLRDFFGDRLYTAFREVKRILDPAGLMNPGKIVDSPPMTENLRIGPAYRPLFPATYYRFEEDGGLGGAVELCTGVGHCRKTLSGVMCPSYIATRDEEHSTRGRANALRSAIAGQLGPEGFTGERLYQVMDLCLECKACKSECPSNVDMAKLKAEFLAHYFGKHGLPLGKRFVAATRRSAEIASRAPRLANFLAGNPLSRWALEKFAGIDRRRIPPRLADRTLRRLHRANHNGEGAGHPSVTLMADTFTNFFEPEIGVAAIQVMEALGYRVRLADRRCCGRPLISSGLLGRARREGAALVRYLEDFEGPIVVLEPSCFSTLRDDFPDLMEDPERTRRVTDRIQSLEEFLLTPENSDRLDKLLGRGPERILFHGHCQQKALIGSDPTLRLLRKLGDSRVDEVPAGCCGMAGAFGYEKEHYDLSEKIGARHLLPEVRGADPSTTLAVSGFSCRSQIRHFTGRTAVHPAIVLRDSLLESRA
jgi:FAD/FMN-containing dehydrogenase/Fe-S oxidoreductase